MPRAAHYLRQGRQWLSRPGDRGQGLVPPAPASLLPSPEVQAHLAMSRGSLEVVEASEAVLGGEWTYALGEVGGPLCSAGLEPKVARILGSWSPAL